MPMTTDNTVEAPIRRTALEEAFAEAERKEEELSTKPEEVKQDDGLGNGETVNEEVVEPKTEEPKTEEPKTELPTTSQPKSQEFAVDKAPQSWRPAQKAKWDKLDPDIRQEVIRREREITRTLGETAEARQLAQQFQQTAAPYMARLQTAGATPMVAFQELLKADYLLSTAPMNQRAVLMAKLISDYGIDIQALDTALSSQPVTKTVDPVTSRMEQMLQERLAPLTNLLTQSQKEEERRTQETIASMTNNPKFPHFDDVREDMADLLELQAKKGVYLSLEQAYTRAVAMNPEVSKLVADQRTEEARKAAALKGNQQAQQALKASKSVGGAPNGTPVAGTSNAETDRRATIAAAFEGLSGR